MNLLLAVLVGYVFGMPIVFRLFFVAHRELWQKKRDQKKLKKNRAAQLSKPLWPTVNERIKFTLKDKRPIVFNKKKETTGPQHRIFFLLLWALGLLLALAGAALSNYWLLLAGFLTFLAPVIFAFVTAKPIIETRRKLVFKMYQIANAKGVLTSDYADYPEAAIQVLEWQDYVKPQKVKILHMRTEFAPEQAEGFLKQFNVIFGAETAWVAFDDKESGKPGWNFEDGEITINAVPPLPRIAKFHEMYVLDDQIAWSFFPIALGVENGVEFKNPETGEVENVLGFDFSGDQAKKTESHGVKVDEKIVVSPMALVAGGTGGGKAEADDTVVRLYKASS